MKILIGGLIGILALASCTEKQQVKQGRYAEQMVASIGFFDNARDDEKGIYYSEVDEKGKVTSPLVHTVALSRMIYGLAYSSTEHPAFLAQAKEAVNFQLQNMIGEVDNGSYFIPTVGNERVEQEKYLDIWQQAYGLCGMTEWYRQTRDAEVLEKIRSYHTAFVNRFQDKEHRGFFADYKVGEGTVSGSKTLQSLMYPITAYMGNLWLADTDNRIEYETIIKEHLFLLAQHGWNDSLKWVNLKFTDKWEPVLADDIIVSPGHNFQLAALFLRSKNYTFLTTEEHNRYQQLGRTIIRETLRKPIWTNNGFNNGFFENVNPYTNEVVSKHKSWWQHCEALIALSFVKEEFPAAFRILKMYYFTTFQDRELGGEWAKVNQDNSPLIEPKGQKGKSVYHHIELLRFLRETGL